MWKSLFLAKNVKKWVKKACKWVVGGSIVGVVEITEEYNFCKIKTTNQTIQFNDKIQREHRQQSHGLL